jgi:hypothetical protein
MVHSTVAAGALAESVGAALELAGAEVGAAEVLVPDPLPPHAERPRQSTPAAAASIDVLGDLNHVALIAIRPS